MVGRLNEPANEIRASVPDVKTFFHGQRVYLAHVLALVRPGAEVPTFRSHQIQAQPLTGWGDDELQLMIDEGRRQSDRQLADLEQIRGRAQWLFTVGAPILTAIAAVFAAFDKGDSGWWVVVWLVSLLVAGYGVVGAAAIMTIRADFDVIDSAVLSSYQPPVLNKLADDYAAMLGAGENTVATRLTVYRQAVVWLIVGGYGALITWLAVH
jgi:hypothetical protein